MNGGVLWLLKSFQNLTRGLGEKFESCCAFCKDCAGGSIQTNRGTFDLGRAKHETCRKAEAASKTALDTCATEMARLKSAKESACKVRFETKMLDNG